MAEKTGFVRVYESTGDGGPAGPIEWQVIVEDMTFAKVDQRHADTFRMALGSNAEVKVSYKDLGGGNTKIGQVRVELPYIRD